METYLVPRVLPVDVRRRHMLKAYIIMGIATLMFCGSLYLCWIAAGMMIESHNWDLTGYHRN